MHKEALATCALACMGPEVKTQKCMHKYYLDIINFVLHSMFYCVVFNLCNLLCMVLLKHIPKHILKIFQKYSENIPKIF
jgi:hypothetical protein